VVTGRVTGGEPRAIRITGKAAGEIVQTSVSAGPEETQSHAALASVWARMQISDLADRMAWQPDEELPQQIRSVALQYGLMSAYTSFVAVDSQTRTAGDFGTTVHQAVPVPAGVRYETTVKE
jgi:Ca-activated chloride channel family protein